MRILIFSWRDIKHPSSGGAEISTHEHAKFWVKKGHEVILFSSYFEGAKQYEVIDGVRVIRRGGQLGGVYIQAFKWYKSLHEKPDIVVDQFHGLPFFTPLYVKEPKVAFIHEVAKEVWWMNHLRFPLNYIYGVIGYFVEPWVFKLFYRNVPFMTVSESTRRDLVAWGIPRKSITVIHNGIERVKVEVKKEKRKTIVFLGAVARDKGIEDAIDVFRRIKEKDDSFQFWVIGRVERGYLRRLKAMCDGLGVRDSVKFFGFVSKHRKFELLRKSHVLLNPSYREGWGLVNIEANSVGTLVVGYNVAGTCDSVRDGKTGLLVQFGDRQALGLAVLRLLGDDHLYQRLQKTAISWSRSFDWEKAARESTRFLEACVRGERF